MSRILTPEDLKAYLAQHTITGEVVYLDVPTPTVQKAAEAVGVDPGHIIKTLLFLAGEDPVVVIANGTARVEWKQLAAYLGIARRKVNMADPDTVLALTGYPVGGVPPLGHLQPFRTIMEAGVLETEWVYGGGGTDGTLVRLATKDLVEHLRAEIVDLQAPQEE
jgi:Cys-tRNA(Pro) deacylase